VCFGGWDEHRQMALPPKFAGFLGKIERFFQSFFADLPMISRKSAPKKIANFFGKITLD